MPSDGLGRGAQEFAQFFAGDECHRTAVGFVQAQAERIGGVHVDAQAIRPAP